MGNLGLGCIRIDRRFYRNADASVRRERSGIVLRDGLLREAYLSERSRAVSGTFLT